MERALVRFEPIEVMLVEGEQLPAVLQDEAHVARHDLRAERVKIALDQRAAIAVLVDDREIDRVARGELRIAGRHMPGPRGPCRSACAASSAYGFEISSAVGKRLKSGSA